MLEICLTKFWFPLFWSVTFCIIFHRLFEITCFQFLQCTELHSEHDRTMHLTVANKACTSLCNNTLKKGHIFSLIWETAMGKVVLSCLWLKSIKNMRFKSLANLCVCMQTCNSPYFTNNITNSLCIVISNNSPPPNPPTLRIHSDFCQKDVHQCQDLQHYLFCSLI